MADTDKDDDLLTEAKENFEVALDGFSNNQDRYEADVRFGRLGEQWASDDIENRKKQGRPSLTINRMPSFIRQVVNDARMNKPSIKVHPNDSDSDPETAEVINGLIRNIEQTSNADLAYDWSIDCACSGGYGFFRVGMAFADMDTFDMDITIDRVLNPLTVFPDPDSVAADSSDWNICFVTEMMPKDEFLSKYPNAEEVDWNPGNLDARDEAWFDKDEIRIAEYWKREESQQTIHLMASGDVITDETYQELEGEYADLGNEIMDTRQTTSHTVVQYILNGQEVLETNPWPGTFIPIIPVYGEEVYIEGERRFYSLIHFAKDPQKIYNYWRTTTTELVAMSPKAPFIGPVGSFNTDMERWQNANTETVAFLEYDIVEGAPPPQRQGFDGPPAGALQEALNASDDMKNVMGMHDARMGAPGQEVSGVALGKRINESDTSTFHFTDNMSRAIRHAGQIIIGLIPHVYSRARMVRVLGEDGSPQTVAVNQPLNKEEEMLQGEMIERKEAMEQVYNLTVGKYDVTVAAGPNYSTQREEARESMIRLITAFPGAAAVTADLVADAMDWPNANVFSKRLKSLLPPGVIDDEADPRVGQLTQQIQGMEQVINQLMADREGKQAENQIDQEKVRQGDERLDIDYMKAQTDQFEAQIKKQDSDVKNAVAMKDEAPDEMAIVLKQMDNDSKEMALTQDAEIERDKLALDQDRVNIERDKLNLERFKVETDAFNAEQTAEGGEGGEPVPASEPVQVFNVQSASKTIDIKRGPNGEIIGANVNEQ